MTSSAANWEATRAASASITILESVESTNSWLVHKAAVQPLDVVLTMNQTAGRGRLTRQWVNQAGDGIAFSFVVPGNSSHEISSPASTWIPLLVGVAVKHSVRSIGVEDASIKWPNDVLVNGQKLAGILCEVRTDGSVVAGVGINVSFAGDRPDARAVSLAELVPDARARLDDVVATVIGFLSELIGADHSHQRDSVLAAMDTIGRDVEVVGRDGGRTRGHATGLDESGALIVRMAYGSTFAVASSDVEHLYQ